MIENIKYLWSLVVGSFRNDPVWKILLKYLVIKLLLILCLIFVPIGVVLSLSLLQIPIMESPIAVTFLAFTIGISLLIKITSNFIKEHKLNDE